MIARSDESKKMQLTRLLVTLPVLLALIATIVRPSLMTWSLLPMPLGLRYAGLVVGLALPVFLIWTFRTIGSNVSETVLTKTNHELISSGPYRWIRHPIYSSGLVLIVTLGVISSSWLFLVFALGATIFVISVIVPREEANLVQQFGDQYEQLKTKTGALFPRLK